MFRGCRRLPRRPCRWRRSTTDRPASTGQHLLPRQHPHLNQEEFVYVTCWDISINWLVEIVFLCLHHFRFFMGSNCLSKFVLRSLVRNTIFLHLLLFYLVTYIIKSVYLLVCHVQFPAQGAGFCLQFPNVQDKLAVVQRCFLPLYKARLSWTFGNCSKNPAPWAGNCTWQTNK